MRKQIQAAGGIWEDDRPEADAGLGDRSAAEMSDYDEDGGFEDFDEEDFDDDFDDDFEEELDDEYELDDDEIVKPAPSGDDSDISEDDVEVDEEIVEDEVPEELPEEDEE